MFLTLGDIVESIAWEGSTKDKIEVARQQIFNFDYPFWNEEHKKSFETLFIRHFYFNEIAQETEGRFFFELENWMLTNMEFYRKRLVSQIWEEKITNPLANYEVFENVSNATSREEVEQILQALERLQSDVGELTKNTNESSNGTYDNTKTITDTLANDEETTSTVTDTLQKITSQEKTASTNETATENEAGEKTGALNEQGLENENAQKVSAGNGVTEKDVQSNTDKTVNEDETNTDFKRELVSNTPQTRLQITTGTDGTGVIEHASTIQEDRDKRLRDTSQVANETSNGTENERTTESNTENVSGDKSLSKTSATTENERLTKDSEKTVADNEQITSTETDTQTRTETNTLSQDKTQTITDTDAQTTSNTQTGSEQQDSTNTQNVDETQNIDKNVSTKETQNMASHKYGSIGVQTYDQLLNGYRTIFMRVEKEMLDDMHNELFMLVY